MMTPAAEHFGYRVHGLIMRSELALPELPAASGDIDVTISFGPLRSAPTGVTPAGTRFSLDSEQACLFYEGAAAFGVRRGREIIIDPYPGVDQKVLRLLLQGPALALLLHQRGALVLHASAVAFGGGGQLFLGAAGAGKSSLAAALHARAHALLSDDIVAMDFTGRPTVHRGVAQLKLWPDATAALVADSNAGVSLRDGLTKRGWLDASPLDQPLPVNRAYVLGAASTCSATRMAPAEAFTELVRHSYVAPLFVESGLGMRHFVQCTALAASGLIWRLGYPRVLAELPHVAAFVEAGCRDDGTPRRSVG